MRRLAITESRSFGAEDLVRGGDDGFGIGRGLRFGPTAHLINTARGDSVDEPALIDALQKGRIAGAGLDVFLHEPSVPEALREMDNVTLLPHIGSATLEVRTAMGMLAVDNLDAFFAGRDLPTLWGSETLSRLVRRRFRIR